MTRSAGKSSMTADLIVKQLMRLPIFRGLTLRQLSEIARNAEPMSYSPGAMIIEQNADADAAILLFAGEAVRVSGPELRSRLEPVPAGSLLGEPAMLVETIYGSTVVARSHVQAARIARDKLHAQMVNDPDIAERLVQNLVGRLHRLADELREVDAVLAGKEPSPAPILPMAALARSLLAAVH
jgi:CRP-like cAMP-binding protein